MHLILTKIVGKAGRIQIERRDGDTLLGRTASPFTDDKHFAVAAGVLDVDKNVLLDVVDKFQRGTETMQSVPLGDSGPGEFTLLLRGRLLTATSGVTIRHVDPLAALIAALYAAVPFPEPLIVWEGTERLAALDVDYHHIPLAARLDPAELELMLARIKPVPTLGWVTHGRGLRLIYTATDLYNADELAAVAAMSVSNLDPHVGLEIKADTRHPGYPVGGRAAGTIRQFQQTEDMESLALFMGARGLEEGQVDEYLQSRGLAVGCKYPHNHCPVRPTDDSHGDPVRVYDNGIYCHSCAGQGKTYGSRVGGWFRYEALVGQQLPSQVRRCLDNLAHWEHAQHVIMDAIPMTEPVARRAYAAALKMRHGADPRVPRVFHAGANFLRFDRRWSTVGGETYIKDPGPILETLPACVYVAPSTGKLTVDRERVARMSNPIDLSEFGYPSLTPIWGLRMYGHRLPYRDPTKLPIVVQGHQLGHECMTNFRPEYIPLHKRGLSEEEAWNVLEEVFPDLYRDAIKLLVAAKGVAEGEIGLPPLIYMSGPTGSSKTACVMIAAAITGDTCHSVQWTYNIERVRQSINEGKEQGSYVVFNEIVKESTRDNKKGDDPTGGSALDFVLNLTPDSLSHKLYIGPVRMGTLPVLCFTDTKLPVSIIKNAQIARRFTHIRLPRRVKWEDSIRSSGLGKIEYLRFTDPRFAKACNALTSYIMDEFFSYPMTFEEIGDKLGFTKLEKCDVVSEKNDALKEFFQQVCVAPAIQAGTSDYKRWSGRGWKVIHREDRSPLSELWMQLCDPSWVTSEQCSETDWSALLGIKWPAEFEMRNYGNLIAVRFIYRTTQKVYSVNEELTRGNVELATGPSEVRDDRLRDTEPGQPADGGVQSVHEGEYDPPPVPGR